MLTIGFTNHYFTLWSVTTTFRKNHSTGEEFESTNFRYLQNLSMELEAAKVKIAAMSDGVYEINLELHGESGSNYFTERRIKDMDVWRFTFGKCQGMDMRESTDRWQLERAMKDERGARRKAIARRRLIDLGELVRRDWKERVMAHINNWDEENPENNFSLVARKWMPKRLAKYYEEIGDRKGHFFTDGVRIQIRVKRIRTKSLETSYNGVDVTIFTDTFETEDGKIVTYRGSSFLDFGMDNFVDIKCTIKHTEFNGHKQTMIQRVKEVVEEVASLYTTEQAQEIADRYNKLYKDTVKIKKSWKGERLNEVCKSMIQDIDEKEGVLP